MKNGISNESASPSAKNQRSEPRTYGFYEEERGRGERLSPRESERLRMRAREHYAEHLAELTPLQRERLRRIAHERYAELTPLEREQLRRMVGERYAELTPLERERLHRFVRERYHGPNGGAER
jgi:predicted GNAT superfamily acetyltransferase